jgi:D-3-phosphoglycerate dehydrogenase
MLGQISTAMARAGLNIHDMLNKSKGDMAYTLVDVDSAVPESLLQELSSISGVLSVRYLPHE